MKKRTIGFILLLLLTALLCIPASAAKVKINKKTATINVGKTVQLKITGTKSKVKWSTSNKKIATVTQKGKVTGKKAGKATITAKVGKKKYKCTVTVKIPVIKVRDVEMSLQTVEVLVGEKYQLEAKISPKNATNKKVTWLSSNTDVATVDQNGNVQAIKKGYTRIYAKSVDDPNTRAFCEFYVIDKNTEIQFEAVEDLLTLEFGESKTLIVNTDKGESITVSSSSNLTTKWGDWITGTNKVYLTVTGGSSGEGTVTVYDKIDKAVKAQIKVKVLPKRNTKVKFEDVADPLEIEVGQEKTLLVSTDKGYSISYKISNNNISAKWGDWITGTGKIYLTVTGKYGGEDTLTVYDTNDNTIKDQITVKVIQPVTSVSFYTSYKTVDVAVGNTKKIGSPYVSPYDATNKGLFWSSSNPLIATVDQEGTVTGVKSGTVSIRATADNGVYDESTVTVHDAEIELPDLSKTFSYTVSGTKHSSCTIEKIEFEKSLSTKNTLYVKMWIYGTKTYDYKPTVSSPSRIGYKLYDMEGYVIASGNLVSEAVFPGEKFKSSTYLGSESLQEGHYILELLDVQG